MEIKSIQPSGGLLVQLMPDDCLTLAWACEYAASDLLDNAASGSSVDRTNSHLFATFAALFAGYALAGAAPGYMTANHLNDFTVDGVARAWSVVDGAVAPAPHPAIFVAGYDAGLRAALGHLETARRAEIARQMPTLRHALDLAYAKIEGELHERAEVRP